MRTLKVFNPIFETRDIVTKSLLKKICCQMEEKYSNYLNYLNKQVPILSVDYSLAPRASYPRALEEVFFLLLMKHFFEEKYFPRGGRLRRSNFLSNILSTKNAIQALEKVAFFTKHISARLPFHQFFLLKKTKLFLALRTFGMNI